MSKKIIIVGMASPYPHEKDGAEIWGVNYTYKHQPNVDRIFFLDDISYFSKGFIEDVNELGVPVMCQRQYEQLNSAVSFPVDDVIYEFGVTYFTSTISYMIAYAIFMRVDEIVLWDILQEGNNCEYKEQKACIEFWVGVAKGCSIEVSVSEKSNILKPDNGATALYGYEDKGLTISKVMANAGLEPVL